MLSQTISPIENNRLKVSHRKSIVTTTGNDHQHSDSTTGQQLHITPLPSSSCSSKKRPRSPPTTSSSTESPLLSMDSVDPWINIHPTKFAQAAFEANGYHDLEAVARDAEARFLPPTAAMQNAYNTKIVVEVRSNNLEGARALYRDGTFQHGCNACNRFGESILHIACRRGHLEMVKFLIGEVGISPSTIRDDYHRTPLHDAFWTSTHSPEVVDYLLEQPFVMDMLVCKDKRGFTPLDYSRGEDRTKWVKFLFERRTTLRPTPTTSLDRMTYSDLIEKVDEECLDLSKVDNISPFIKRAKIVG